MRIPVMVLLTATLSTTLSAAQAQAAALPDAPHVAVTGQHELRVTPDILFMALSIAEVGKDVAAARLAVEQRSAQLIRQLLAAGVAKNDISSAQLQITPHYDWNNREQIYVGSEVSRSIEITLRDLSRHDMLIRSLIEARVAQINQTELRYANEKQLRAQALQGAVADARGRAALLIEGLPQKLGPVYALNTQSAGGIFKQTRFQVADRAMLEAFQPGEITLSETVEVVFYLLD